jgi:putative PIN family toxin of toxin-antitoxin system
MSTPPPRVVLDTVVFVQALISGRGPSAGVIERLNRGEFVLLLSDALLSEIREVPLRVELTRRYSQLTPARVNAFVDDVASLAVMLSPTTRAFPLPRDPDDEVLIDLAVAGGAEYLVTWNARHLTYLMRQDTDEGREFCSRFPGLQILSPPEFLSALDREST